jgi:hypothetical protein
VYNPNFSEYNDYKAHNVRIKIMPVKNILLQTKVMNNPDYFREITFEETKKFGFDRINYNGF